MSGKIFNWAGVIALLLLSGCGSKGVPESEPEPEVTVDVAPVLATTISQKVTADAIVYTHEAADNYLDARPSAAALKSIHKKAGQR